MSDASAIGDYKNLNEQSEIYESLKKEVENLYARWDELESKQG